MNIVETFNKHFKIGEEIKNDFLLVECENDIMIGLDSKYHISVVVKSGSPKMFPIIQKTQNMSIECNVKVNYTLNGNIESGVVHILRCLTDSEKEKELFLELATVLIANNDRSEESIMDTFNILRTFFSNKNDISDNELIGLYAELYTICKYHDALGIEKYWQSRDKMKFDFSISEKTKLEIKATTKNSRTHHFRHEQLMTEIYEIFILSYMLRYDDEGLSLYDIILQSKEYLASDPRKLLKVNQVLKNVSEDRLKNLRFNQGFTEANMHFYKAEDIPKFNEVTPSGVANAEYDCVLDKVDYIEDENIIQILKNVVEGTKNV